MNDISYNIEREGLLNHTDRTILKLSRLTLLAKDVTILKNILIENIRMEFYNRLCSL